MNFLTIFATLIINKMAKVLRLTDFTNLDEKFLQDCKVGIKKLNEYSEEYSKLSSLDVNDQLKKLESLKREHGSFLLYFLNYYTQVVKYKENFEFLAHERKELKSKVLEKLVKGGKNQTTADKIVYADKEYISEMNDIQEIRKFFIYVDECYSYHKEVLARAIFQSISVLQKEVENAKKAN